MSTQPMPNTITRIPSQFNQTSMPDRSSELDLDEQIDVLRLSAEWSTGIARKVLVAYPDFQVTLRLLAARARIAEHYNPGRISVQTLRGLIRMHADGRTFELPAGKMLILDRAVAHDVEAVVESVFLLTVAYPEQR